MSCNNAKWERNDKRTTGKGDQVLIKVLLEAFERGKLISARKVRNVVGVVYCVRALLKGHDGAVSEDDSEEGGGEGDATEHRVPGAPAWQCLS